MSDSASNATGFGFPTTLWSQVVSAGRGSPRALESLARRYEPVILKLVRWYLKDRRTHGHEPEDLAQEFFLYLLAQREAVLGRADRSRGRFRAWLRTCLKHWLYNWTDRVTAEKRGGGREALPLAPESDSRPGVDVAAPDDLDREFDRQWARSVMDGAIARLRADAGAGELEPHDLKAWELKFGGGNLSDREVGEALGLTTNEAVVSLRRAKKRFKVHLEAEVESTVATKADLEEEIRELRRVFGA